MSALLETLDERPVKKCCEDDSRSYIANSMALLPYEHEVLKRYIDASPEYLWVEMPEDYWTGDEMKILKRHGFQLGFPPFSREFYDAAELLLSEKNVTQPEFTFPEINLIKSAENFKVTKKVLIQICERHGVNRFKDGHSHVFVSMESNKMSMAKGLMGELHKRGLATEEEFNRFKGLQDNDNED